MPHLTWPKPMQVIPNLSCFSWQWVLKIATRRYQLLLGFHSDLKFTKLEQFYGCRGIKMPFVIRIRPLHCCYTSPYLISSSPFPYFFGSSILSLSLSHTHTHTHTHTNTSSTLIHAVMQALETQRGQTKSFTFSTSKWFSFFIVVLVRRFCVNLNSGHFYFMDFWCNGKCLPQKWQVVDLSQESTSPPKKKKKGKATYQSPLLDPVESESFEH